MKNFIRKKEIMCLFLIVLSFIMGIYFYYWMPDMMASHWNYKGEADGYSPKAFGLFFMPAISVIMFLAFLVIPKIDPLKNNIEKFRNHFDNFILILFLFLFYLYCLTIMWNLGARFEMNQRLAVAFGVLFYYAGVLVENSKKNWFIGIRTPWTLSSDKVWEKTHKLGGDLFKKAGFIAFSGVFFPSYAFLLLLVPVILFTVYIVAYSYFEYRKEKRSH